MLFPLLVNAQEFDYPPYPFNNGTLDTIWAEVFSDDFTSDITGWAGFASDVLHYTSDYNSVGRTNVLFDSADATENVRAYFTGVGAADNKTYKLTYDYYLPSSNTTTNGIKPYLNGFKTNQTVTDTWTSATEYFLTTGADNTLRFYQSYNDGIPGTVSADDKIYLDNVKIEESSL